MEYYDLILGFIPASIAAATGVLSLLGVGVAVGVLIGSIVALAVILHALFVRGPTSTGTPDTANNTSAAYSSAD